MSVKIINLGTEPDGLGGDTLRSSATKTNENFVYVDNTLKANKVKLDSIDLDLADKQTRVTALENKDTSLDLEVASLKTKTNTTNSNLTSTDSKVTALETKTTTTNNTLTTSNTKIKALEDKNVVTDNSLSTNTTGITANATAIATVNTYINKATNAASKEVGITTGKIPLAENIPVLAKTSELQTSILNLQNSMGNVSSILDLLNGEIV